VGQSRLCLPLCFNKAKPMIQLHDKTFEMFISEAEVQFVVDNLAKRLADDFADEVPVFVGVLNGAFMFLSDLVKAYALPCEVAFVQVSSYEGMQSTGQVVDRFGLPKGIEGKTVILVEDIVDTGHTLSYLREAFKSAPIKRLKIAALFLKPESFQYDFRLDYVGIRMANRFIVGYGLDYNGLGRNLRHVYQWNGV